MLMGNKQNSRDKLSLPVSGSCHRPEDVIQRYMEEVSAAPDEVKLLPLVAANHSSPSENTSTPVSCAGLHHLYGSAVQPVQLRVAVGGRGCSEHPAERRGEVRQVRPHAAHALHVGHVQQRNQGSRRSRDREKLGQTSDQKHPNPVGSGSRGIFKKKKKYHQVM